MSEKLYQVFLSSTYTDLIDERKSVADALAKSGFLVAGMELFPATSESQFDYIKRIIDRCDYYVLILAGRYGSMNGEGISYTEAEFHYAKSSGKPILVFYHGDIAKLPLANSETDNDKREKLQAFKRLAMEGRLCKAWMTASDLARDVVIGLHQEVMRNPAVGWVRGDQILTPKLLDELENLRSLVREYEAASNDRFSLPTFPAHLLGPDDVFPIEFKYELTFKREKIVDQYKTATINGIIDMNIMYIFMSIYHMIIRNASEFEIRKSLDVLIDPAERVKIFHEHGINNIDQIEKYGAEISNIVNLRFQLEAIDLIKTYSAKDEQGYNQIYNYIPPVNYVHWAVTDTGRRLASLSMALKKNN